MKNRIRSTLRTSSNCGRVPYSICILMLFYFSLAAAVTNSIPKELLDSTIVWGNETNEFCSGLIAWQDAKVAPPTKMIRVCLLTSKTNVMWNYLLAPGNKFLKLELRDKNGVIVAPLSGKMINDDLPNMIVEEDLPTTPTSVHLRRPWLVLFAGQPLALKDINIQEVYKVKEEGDYDLCACVSIYQFAADRKSIFRIDLPCVNTRIHLAPSPD